MQTKSVELIVPNKMTNVFVFLKKNRYISLFFFNDMLNLQNIS